MRNFLIGYFSEKYLAQWVIYFVDLAVVFFAFQLAVLLRLNFEWSAVQISDMIWHGVISTICYGLVFAYYQSHSAIIRHASIGDIQKLTKISFFAFVSLILLSYLLPSFDLKAIYLQSKSVLIIHFLLILVTLSVGRLIIKMVYASFLTSGSTIRKKVLVYGAGEPGVIARQTLDASTTNFCRVVGFVDDKRSLIGKSIEGVRVYSSESVFDPNFLRLRGISELVIATENIAPAFKRKLIEVCLGNKIKVKEVPPHDKWIRGELSAKQIKTVAIEDLLGRGVILVDNPAIRKYIQNKVVMVSGAAGSIGSEIVRQLFHFRPEHIIVLDQAESELFNLEQEINGLALENGVNYTSVIGNIRDAERIRQIFNERVPDLIFHAAAYKHVPLMEEYPMEAVSTNILGTKILADLASDFEVQKFVMVSTDKAINPTSVMGASKRMAEMYIQGKNFTGNSNTQFITTRFGNVLGSNGSVVPLFKKQIENGGPITITHKKITRFFMTIPEACNLVLEAGVMGRGGEIFIFDMGESVKIYDLALKMIQLSGLELNRDIEIKVTGLRPGEKLYEELMLEGEERLPTHHPKIYISKLKDSNFEELQTKFLELEVAQSTGNVFKAVSLLKSVIPEYKSNNSIFEKMDLIAEVV